MNCSHCMKSIDPHKAWKSTSNRFFCNEFCSDAEPLAPKPREDRLLQYHADNGYLERLQRLVTMRRSIEKSAA